MSARRPQPDDSPRLAPFGPQDLIDLRREAERQIRMAHVPYVLEERRVDILAAEWIDALLRWATSCRYDFETDSWEEPPTMPRYEPDLES